MRYVLYFTCMLWAIICIPEAHAQQQVGSKSWTLTLAGHKEIPPVSTAATGSVTLTLKGDSLFVSGSFQDLNSPYKGAHIFYGAGEQVGNAIISLTTKLSEDQRSGSLPKQKNRFKLNNAQKTLLLEGQLYIAISSSREKYGEIRSPIK